jgi:ABC-2 type transport system permease protein
MGIVSLLAAETRMTLWSMKRYMFNTVSMVVVMYVIFLGMFWGVKSIAGQNIQAGSLDSMVVGYVLWMSAMFALQGTGGIVLEESQKGTLEQLYLSPLGSELIFLSKAILATLFNFFFITVLLYLAMLTTGRYHSVNLPFFYGMLLLSLLSLNGIGFMMGGIGLIHKRINAVYGILSFGMIGLMLLPVYPFTTYSLLPFLAGARTINMQITGDATFPAWWYLYVAANSIFYLVVGILVFRLFEKRARKLNKLGQY